jgi:hypothetical protein
MENYGNSGRFGRSFSFGTSGLVSSAFPFVPTSDESIGPHGAPALALREDFADPAVQAGGPGLSWTAFI